LITPTPIAQVYERLVRDAFAVKVFAPFLLIRGDRARDGRAAMNFRPGWPATTTMGQSDG
jgi:hypothetical protein